METHDTIFFDGHCGLCHGFVRFALKRDRAASFAFAPLHGEYFQSVVPAEKQATLPDSVIVITGERSILVKSAAVLHVLNRLGGIWAALAAIASVFPVGLRDFSYDFTARLRGKLFAAPPDICPVVPPGLRNRFRL